MTPGPWITNRIIGGHKPRTYLASLEKTHGVDAHRLDEILRSHLIELVALRNDAFDTFIRNVRSSCSNLIERAAGKQVTGRDSDETVAPFGNELVTQGDGAMVSEVA